MTNFVRIFSIGPRGDEPEERPDEHVQPAWFRPPDRELDECVPLTLVAGRSERAVVTIKHATAYSTGVTFEFLAAGRSLRERDTNRLFHEQHVLDGEEGPPDGFLRVGIELADGSRVSNLGRGRRLWRPDHEPEGPVLIHHGGGGGSGGAGSITLNPGYWLWPLPPPGPLRVFVEWPRSMSRSRAPSSPPTVSSTPPPARNRSGPSRAPPSVSSRPGAVCAVRARTWLRGSRFGTRPNSERSDASPPE